MSITYIKGDATNPIGKNKKLIVHICNDIGLWGKGFVLALSKKWKYPEYEYKRWFKHGCDFRLGNVQIVEVEDDNVWVANMICQKGVYNINNSRPIRYKSLQKSLEMIQKYVKNNNMEVHMPRIGCGLAGGKWEIIEKIILDTLCSKNINVYVYDL